MSRGSNEIIHQQQGFGLFSIRERLTHVGGTFAVESTLGRGTKVTLVAPLQDTPTP
jgi:signal transduction histidine kinase